MKRLYRVIETSEYVVEADTEEEAEQLFASYGPEVTGVAAPVKFVRVRDRDVVEVRNARGLPIVVVGQ